MSYLKEEDGLELAKKWDATTTGNRKYLAVGLTGSYQFIYGLIAVKVCPVS